MEVPIRPRDAAGDPAARGRPEASPPRPPLRFALYSHDTLGLGHVRRNLLIARALVRAFPRSSALLLSGAEEAAGLPFPAGIDCLTLPAVRKLDGVAHYEPRRLALPIHDVLEVRAATLEAALSAYHPDLLVVDKAPRGVDDELDGALAACSRAGSRLVLGLRDVLDDPERIRGEWSLSRAVDAMRGTYDEVWVYGDPAVFDVRRAQAVPVDLAAKFRFTGYLDPAAEPEPEPFPDPLEGLPPGKTALCLLGGGEMGGAAVAEAFLVAEVGEDLNRVVVLGPFMPDEDRRRLVALATGPRTRVLGTVAGTASLTRRADRVVAMAGYNTVCEVLSLGKPALLVPRAHPLREQWLRAERLRELGLVETLHPDRLTPGRIAEFLSRDDRPAARAKEVLDFGGMESIPRLARDLLATPRPSASPAPNR